jgi:hypothetical protein
MRTTCPHYYFNKLLADLWLDLEFTWNLIRIIAWHSHKMVLFCIVTVRLLEDFDSALITGVYSTTPSGSISKQVFTLTRIYSTQQVACNHTFFHNKLDSLSTTKNVHHFAFVRKTTTYWWTQSWFPLDGTTRRYGLYWFRVIISDYFLLYILLRAYSQLIIEVEQIEIWKTLLLLICLVSLCF